LCSYSTDVDEVNYYYVIFIIFSIMLLGVSDNNVSEDEKEKIKAFLSIIIIVLL